MYFDTNIIINTLNSNISDQYSDLVFKHIKNKSAFISVIALSEVLAFPKLTEIEKEYVKFYIKSNFKIKAVSIEIGELAAEISINKRKETGKKLKLTDAIIAATVIIDNSELLTFDKEDFKNIKELKLYNLK